MLALLTVATVTAVIITVIKPFSISESGKLSVLLAVSLIKVCDALCFWGFPFLFFNTYYIKIIIIQNYSRVSSKLKWGFGVLGFWGFGFQGLKY